MQSIGVAVGVFSVQVAVEYQTDTIYLLRRIKGISNCLVCLAEIAVVIAPNTAIQTVQQSGAITVIAGKGCLLCQFRRAAAQTGQEAIVLHECVLDFFDLLLCGLARQ